MEPNNNISNNAMLSALAGILFFAPLIKTNGNDFNPLEQQFIQGYKKVGKLNFALGGLIIGILIIQYFLPNSIRDWILTMIAGIICLISFISSICCINQIQLFDINETQETEIHQKDKVIISFIPLYNRFLRYKSPNFQTPYRRLKESVLWRTIFIFATLLFGYQLGTMIIGILIIRIILLLINKDIIPNNLKKLINHSFLIYPEEIIGYLIGRIKSTYKKSDSSQEINRAKQNYSTPSASHINILLQYLSSIGILVLLIHPTSIYEISIIAIALLFWIGKTIMNYLQYQKIPNIPILYELLSLIIK
ncbi:MAG: hypothetical protein LBH96_00360 [Candidatus Peribacteria bacterium]|jgi:hypothetical protein|nr:hypothetical protein [Candidatus Peribacteria bacterium]